MNYPLYIIFAVTIMVIVIILLRKKSEQKTSSKIKIVDGVEFEWISGKAISPDDAPHWLCKIDQFTVCVLPPSILGSNWRIIKERNNNTIGYQEIEDEKLAFEQAVKWINE